MEQSNQNNRFRAFVPPLPAPRPSIGRGLLNNTNVRQRQPSIIPQTQRINFGRNNSNNNNSNNRMFILRQPDAIIINANNNNSNNNEKIEKKQKKKKERKTIEEHALLFLKWMQELPEEGYDVTHYYFDKAKGGVFCTACQAKYNKGFFFNIFFFLVFTF